MKTIMDFLKRSKIEQVVRNVEVVYAEPVKAINSNADYQVTELLQFYMVQCSSMSEELSNVKEQLTTAIKATEDAVKANDELIVANAALKTSLTAANKKISSMEKKIARLTAVEKVWKSTFAKLQLTPAMGTNTPDSNFYENFAVEQTYEG